MIKNIAFPSDGEAPVATGSGGPDNRQLLEGYSARRRQEALTNFPITRNPRSFPDSDTNPVREKKGISLPFRRGSPCCDLYEGPNNRQLLEGYSARRRQEASNESFLPRTEIGSLIVTPKGKKGISLPFRRGSPCCDLFEGPDNRRLLEGYSARRRQEASNESFLPRPEVGSLSGRVINSSGDKQEVVSGRKTTGPER